MIQQYKLFAHYLPATGCFKCLLWNEKYFLFLKTEYTHKYERFLREMKIAKPKTVKNKCIIYKIRNNKGHLLVIKAQ